MNANVKRRWIRALRSGKYRQTKGALRKSDRFCCLGVLCDISRQEEWGQKRGPEVNYGMGDFELPSIKVMSWSGLTKVQAHGLACMNDDGKRFSTIADYIEREL